MAGKRNSHGVNFSCDCYRTIKGAHFVAWLSFPSEERIKAYRDAGVRCRRFGEELFINESDKDKAYSVDFEQDKKRGIA